MSMLLAWVDLRVFMCFQNSVTLLLVGMQYNLMCVDAFCFLSG